MLGGGVVPAVHRLLTKLHAVQHFDKVLAALKKSHRQLTMNNLHITMMDNQITGLQLQVKDLQALVGELSKSKQSEKRVTRSHRPAFSKPAFGRGAPPSPVSAPLKGGQTPGNLGKRSRLDPKDSTFDERQDGHVKRIRGAATPTALRNTRHHRTSATMDDADACASPDPAVTLFAAGAKSALKSAGGKSKKAKDAKVGFQRGDERSPPLSPSFEGAGASASASTHWLDRV